jgi:Hint domain
VPTKSLSEVQSPLLAVSGHAEAATKIRGLMARRTVRAGSGREPIPKQTSRQFAPAARDEILYRSPITSDSDDSDDSDGDDSDAGPNTPHRELFLSRYHCLYLDGVLIPVVELLNNSTITRCSAEDLREIEYFHFKLERHSVIYAEGAACETLQAVTAVNSDNVEFEEYRRNPRYQTSP